MRIQLWSIYYEPEPTGIGPISAVWARTMQSRGHDITVIAAHPHYPSPMWGRRLRPCRDERHGVPIVRLPIWAGRSTTATRLRQELSFTTSLALAAPALGTPDAVVAISPCFPALAPAVCAARARRMPLILWLQDVLPDGATATGVLHSGLTVRAARRLERLAYGSAQRIVVLSGNVRRNLLAKGVAPEKIVVASNPATRPIPSTPLNRFTVEPRRVLTMGNIGLSQGLTRLVRAFEDDEGLAAREVRFVITGDGVAAASVRAEIRTDRVAAPGLVTADELERELSRAQVAVVSQHYDAGEFNVPSKLMNFMAAGLPVVASVPPSSEAARIIRRSGCGWVTDSNDLREFTAALASAVDDSEECARRGIAGLEYAHGEFRPELLADIFERTIEQAVGVRGSRTTPPPPAIRPQRGSEGVPARPPAREAGGRT